MSAGSDALGVVHVLVQDFVLLGLSQFVEVAFVSVDEQQILHVTGLLARSAG
jgi:hypothetical protein